MSRTFRAETQRTLSTMTFPRVITSTAQQFDFPSVRSACHTYTFGTGPPSVPSNGRYRSGGTSNLRTREQRSKWLAFGTTRWLEWRL